MSNKNRDSHVAAIVAAKQQLGNTLESDGHKLIKRLFKIPKHIKRNISLALSGQTLTGFDDISLKVKNSPIINSLSDQGKINQLIGSFIAIKWILKSIHQENLLSPLELDRLLVDLKVILLSFAAFPEVAEIIIVAFSEHIVTTLLSHHGDSTNYLDLTIYGLLELGLYYQTCCDIGEALKADPAQFNQPNAWYHHIKALRDLKTEITPETWAHFNLNSLESRTEYDDRVNNIKKRGHMWDWLTPKKDLV